MRPRKTFDLAVLTTAGGFYLLNRLWLAGTAGGPLGWFLTCYANDLWAGAAILAWTDCLLLWGRLPPLKKWRWNALLLVLCGLVWEVLTPAWKPTAVFDWWDLLAYQAGGFLWYFGNKHYKC